MAKASSGVSGDGRVHVRGSIADCSGDDGLSGNWGICLYLPSGDFNHYDQKHGAESLKDYC